MLVENMLVKNKKYLASKDGKGTYLEDLSSEWWGDSITSFE